jgi:hypothetical protein
MIIDSPNILTENLVIWVQNLKTKKVIGCFHQILKHDCGLIDGRNKYLLFEHFKSQDEPVNMRKSISFKSNASLSDQEFDLVLNPPKLVLRLAYLNSIFTRK